MAEITNLYKRISLEFLNSFPGHVFLRFEPYGKVPAVMVQVLPGDIVAISKLADPASAADTGFISYDDPADDDFERGDSG